MKKHDEGYVLPLVLVVLTIMTLVAAYVLAGTLQTVTNQQNSIAQMKDRYGAQGAIEKVVAQLTDTASLTSLMGDSPQAALQTKIESICSSIYAAEETTKDTDSELPSTPDLPSVDTAEQDFTYQFTITSTYNTIEIESKITLSGKIKKNDDGTYAITDPEITYQTYDVQLAGGDE